ncbi:MAG: 1-deoxy-D-xylulose-5-phosphate reductoisomerase [Bacteroidales bacterium]|nr:1-deoxy-D-xylulose-5-phosphate reductoisomerase [Bacteroidales bacterium]
MQKHIAILGSTGSIGTQALEIISKYPDRFSIEVLTANNNYTLLAEQARKYMPDSVVIGNVEHYDALGALLSDLPVKVYAGHKAIEEVAGAGNSDTVLAAMVGYSGLKPAISAVEAGKVVALANKETLVVAGHIIRRAAIESGSFIIPVDSEHSAIFQCLTGEGDNPVEKITLTASGGPFREMTAEQLAGVTPAQALKHPNWDMGSKVTIDSASLMNKGLEVIEARWLFGMPAGKIEVVIHPQSIIHSMVHFADGSVKAQMGMPDMRVPIIYALSYPERLVTDLPRLDFTKCTNLTFHQPDRVRFRNLSLAYQALEAAGNMPCALNSANEVAVTAFLCGEVGFLQMSDVVEYVLDNTTHMPDPTLEELEKTDADGRLKATEYIRKTIDRR